MAKTAAEKQRDYRQRHSRLVAALHTENAELRAELAHALTEVDRLTGQECRHPSGVDEVGRCQLCAADLT
jgi:recombinational DNA repair protein RecR